MPNLIVCSDCQRHVRVTEGGCPFCGSRLTIPAKVPAIQRGARRAAMVAVSAALASTAFVACGDDDGDGQIQGGGGASSGGGGSASDGGGGSASEGGGGSASEGGGGTTSEGGGGATTDGGGGSGGDGFGGNIAPPYGAPPI